MESQFFNATLTLDVVEHKLLSNKKNATVKSTKREVPWLFVIYTIVKKVDLYQKIHHFLGRWALVVTGAKYTRPHKESTAKSINL